MAEKIKGWRGRHARTDRKKKGCGAALSSTYALIALVAVLGFAFVVRKKESSESNA